MNEMILPDYPDDNCLKNRAYYDDDVEISGEVYDIVIVENWQAEQQECIESEGLDKQWSEDGELLAEIYVDQQEQIEQNVEQEKVVQQQNDSDDCVNLSWLLNFKLDDLINSYGDEASTSGSSKKEDCKSERLQKAAPQRDDSSAVSNAKPPFTYTKLIELALREKGELTVSGIYQWISQRYPFFKPYDDRWKNSVRHNLSISPHFRKGAKASRGAGHLWTVATPSDLDRQLAEHKKPEVEPTMEQEVEMAAASILQDDSDFLSPVTVEHVANVYDFFNGPLSYTY